MTRHIFCSLTTGKIAALVRQAECRARITTCERIVGQGPVTPVCGGTARRQLSRASRKTQLIGMAVKPPDSTEANGLWMTDMRGDRLAAVVIR